MDDSHSRGNQHLFSFLMRVKSFTQLSFQVTSGATVTDLRENAQSLEKMALKYDMPMLAVVALEELQRNLQVYSSTGGLVANDYWNYAERAAFWKHTGLLNACVEALAQPL